MRIAYITYEYPPDIGTGGIATYVYESARMMKKAGFDVEVFAGSYSREGLFDEDGIIVNRIHINGVEDFACKVVEVFSERQKLMPFDLYETPEINANAKYVAQQFPEIPFVTKLHTPTTLQIKLYNYYTPLFSKIRFVAGALRRGKIDLGYWRKHDLHPENDPDYRITVSANKISAPSAAMKKWAENYWRIAPAKISILENPYSPPDKLLNQCYNGRDRNYLTFVGKLNIHKGLLVLTEALPEILKKCPELKVRFIGDDGSSHIKGITMKTYLQKKLNLFKSRIDFTGPLPVSEIHKYFGEARICVFPSIWEAFGYVVLEAMSAGIPVVVSKGSGMEEIIDYGNAGVLVNPFSSSDVSKKIISLYQNQSKQEELSKTGRERVLQNYTPSALVQKHIKFYKSILTK